VVARYLPINPRIQRSPWANPPRSSPRGSWFDKNTDDHFLTDPMIPGLLVAIILFRHFAELVDVIRASARLLHGKRHGSGGYYTPGDAIWDRERRQTSAYR
jgi:hypothetical protein